MTDLERCIGFWENLLAQNRFVMTVTVIARVESTIKYLKELQRLKEEETGVTGDKS